MVVLDSQSEKPRHVKGARMTMRLHCLWESPPQVAHSDPPHWSPRILLPVMTPLHLHSWHKILASMHCYTSPAQLDSLTYLPLCYYCIQGHCCICPWVQNCTGTQLDRNCFLGQKIEPPLLTCAFLHCRDHPWPNSLNWHLIPYIWRWFMPNFLQERIEDLILKLSIWLFRSS